MTGTGAPSGLARFAPAFGVRELRLWSGLILFTYVALHLINHGLGNISLEWMERGLKVQKFIWQGMVGTTLLYGALTAHFALGVYALYERRRLHWTPAELTQLILGLAIPPLLANHLADTRIALAVDDLDKAYAQILYTLQIAHPALGWIQLTLLVVAWLHGCIGIAFWLRLKPWFARSRAVLLSVAVLLPVLALLGYLQGGRAVLALSLDPAWRAVALGPAAVGTPSQHDSLTNLRNGFFAFDGTALLLVMLGRLGRALGDRARGRVRVSYADGHQQWIPLGFSVMEASMLAGIPHAGLCGARGRCSLCRVRVLSDDAPPPPQGPERHLLERVGADPARVRLACQLRPLRDIMVIPLVPPNAQSGFLHRHQRDAVPRDQFLVVMCVDMRGSTRLAESHLPYDSVFILQRFISAITSAVVDAGGDPNQFLGDGLLAIFGRDCNEPTACRRAIGAMIGVARNIRQLSDALALELHEPIGFGIGLHCGWTVVGEIGFGDHFTSTALGDTPNVASRLEALTGGLGCEALVSDSVLQQAGYELNAFPSFTARLRGRAEPVPARLIARIDASQLRYWGRSGTA